MSHLSQLARIFLKDTYLLIYLERMCKRGKGQRKRERENESQADSPLSMEPDSMALASLICHSATTIN